MHERVRGRRRASPAGLGFLVALVALASPGCAGLFGTRTVGGSDIRSRKVVFRFGPVTDAETSRPSVEYRLANHSGHTIMVDSRRMSVTIRGRTRRCYADDSLYELDVDPGHEIDVSWCVLAGLPAPATIAYGGVVVAVVRTESGHPRVEPRRA